MYGNGPGGTVNGTRPNLTSVDTTTEDYLQQTAVPMQYETHGGEDVPLYASGPMAHLFSSTLEQNVIPHVMAYASCVGANRQHCAESPNNHQNNEKNNDDGDEDPNGFVPLSLQLEVLLASLGLLLTLHLV